MLVVKKGDKTYKYDGTLNEMFDDYYIPDTCLPTIEVQEYTQCEFEVLGFTSLPSLDL